MYARRVPKISWIRIVTMLRVFLYILLASPVFCAIDLTVVTAKGSIKGQRASDGNYTTFFGIPYAKVDDRNPFGKSLDYPAFNKTFVASNATIKCPQFGFNGGYTGTLDCLRLNIYVPNSVNTKNPVPVLVWFHGGRFAVGSAGEFGGKYLVQQGIVVVTVNYRLGPYGFLCLDDPAVPGNQGLKDQVAALKWIKGNIAAFAGNAAKVTIAGESAGASSVDLHLFSPYETLFDKAIIESGSSYFVGMFVEADHGAAIKLATHLGHHAHQTRDALQFLTTSNHANVIKAFQNLSLELSPCQEKRFQGVKNFVNDDPFHLHSYRMKNMTILVGYNSKEEFGRFANQSEEYFRKLGPYFYDKLKENFVLEQHELEKLTYFVRSFYLGSKPMSKDTMLEIVDFSSDFMNIATEMSVHKYLWQGAERVYKYLFSYVGGSPFRNMTGAGASHGEEVAYLFDTSRQILGTAEQKLIRDRMTTMWGNFVKYGNPTPQTTNLLPVKWTPITRHNGTSPYLNIDVQLEMRDKVYHHRMAFWELLYHVYWRKSVLADRHRRPSY